MTPLRPRASALVAVTALCALAGAAAPAAGATAPPAAAPVELVVTTVDGTGAPAFVTVAAPTLAQAQASAAAVPGVVDVDASVPVHALAAPNDPGRPQQWSHTTLGADDLLAGPAGRTVTVAVLDTGVAPHRDFARGTLLCELGEDHVGDGATPDGCADPHGHGTHVAGIIAAARDNGVGVAGFGRALRIIPFRVLDATGSGRSQQVAQAVVNAADKGADVINMSLAGPGSGVYDTAVAYARRKGVVVVAGAGNNRQTGNAVRYPAAAPGVVSVAATDETNAVAPFSYAGPEVDLAAPGVRIYGLSHLADGYTSKSGTSMATPVVAAAAALYRLHHPEATEAQVVERLTATARDIGPAGRDDESGVGLVDLAGLGLTRSSRVAPPPPPPSGSRGLTELPPTPATGRTTAVALVGSTVLRPGESTEVALRRFAPRSTVTVTQSRVVERRVRVDGQRVTRTRTVTSTLLRWQVAADGTAGGLVRPLEAATPSTLVVQGVDADGRAVSFSTPVRVGA